MKGRGGDGQLDMVEEIFLPRSVYCGIVHMSQTVLTCHPAFVNLLVLRKAINILRVQD